MGIVGEIGSIGEMGIARCARNTIADLDFG